jgi:hypothetical protein
MLLNEYTPPPPPPPPIQPLCGGFIARSSISALWNRRAVLFQNRCKTIALAYRPPGSPASLQVPGQPREQGTAHPAHLHHTFPRAGDRARRCLSCALCCVAALALTCDGCRPSSRHNLSIDCDQISISSGAAHGMVGLCSACAQLHRLQLHARCCSSSSAHMIMKSSACDCCVQPCPWRCWLPRSKRALT